MKKSQNSSELVPINEPVNMVNPGGNLPEASKHDGGGGSGGGGGFEGGGGGDDGGGGGGFRGRRITTCSFCGKTSREVGPMVEGPNDIYICSNCTDLCQNIFRQPEPDALQPQWGFMPEL